MSLINGEGVHVFVHDRVPRVPPLWTTLACQEYSWR